MFILTIRSDNPEAEIGLYSGGQELIYHTWQAHRELAETIHLTLKDVLEKAHKGLADIEGIVIFKGPGSFTGLRIGFSVANTLAYALHVPIVAAGGEQWLIEGQSRLQSGENEQIAQPEYGAPPRTTIPKK